MKRNLLHRLTLLLPTAALPALMTHAGTPDLFGRLDSLVLDGHTVAVWDTTDTIPYLERGERLTEKDYIEVAEELGVDVAAIKAVVEIEAGKSHRGFWSPGKPLINFDLSMYRQFAKRNNLNLATARKRSPVIFNRPNDRKYGSRQAAQQARLDAAMAIDERTAVQGTFWGMFQIGGFNWKKCGADSISQFVELMSRSERDQLELFVNFLRSTGLDKHLREHNWAAFARGYNGPSYASRGYHTRLASAYRRYSAQ